MTDALLEDLVFVLIFSDVPKNPVFGGQVIFVLVVAKINYSSSILGRQRLRCFGAIRVTNLIDDLKVVLLLQNQSVEIGCHGTFRTIIQGLLEGLQGSVQLIRLLAERVPAFDGLGRGVARLGTQRNFDVFLHLGKSIELVVNFSVKGFPILAFSRAFSLDFLGIVAEL